MSTEEFRSNPAEVAAPEQDITAGPESVEGTPETQETEAKSKVFTQEELDAAIGKRLAKERRKWERETVRTPEVQPVHTEPVSPDQFENVEAYAEALALQKAQELVRQREVQAQRSQIETAFAERVEDALVKYDDYEQVAHNPNLRITQEMAETIKASELGPDLAYWLGSNPKEADRISQLSPLQQARELGKIEAKIANEPVVKKTSSAPAPINPVTAHRTANSTYDTTDPRSTKTMTDSEWIEAERERQRRKFDAQRNR